MKHLLILTLCLTATAALAVAGNEQPTTAPDAMRFKRWPNGPSADADYFPIAVWLQQPKNAAKYKAIGINLYVGLWKGPTTDQLAALKKAGMPVICHQNEVGLTHRDNDIIVGWLQQDEPDNAQLVSRSPRRYGPPVPPGKIVDIYKRLRRRDPTRPVLLNLGQGVANDEWVGRGSGAKLSDYETYVKGGDIISFDVYPVVGIRKPDGENYLHYVAKGVTRLKRWTGGEKVLFNCIECTHISNPRKKATPHQVRAEVWMSIIHGSRGLIYFAHQFKPRFIEAGLLADKEMSAAVAKINARIKSLAAAINSPAVENPATVESSNEGVPVALMTRRHAGATYLFAVGMRNAKTRGTFTVPGVDADATVEVLGEDRTIRMRDNAFGDGFEAWDVHLYRIAGE